MPAFYVIPLGPSRRRGQSLQLDRGLFYSEGCMNISNLLTRGVCSYIMFGFESRSLVLEGGKQVSCLILYRASTVVSSGAQSITQGLIAIC